jgi:uncharacterized protein (DUF433 family)
MKVHWNLTELPELPIDVDTQNRIENETQAGPIVKTTGCCGGSARLKERRVPVWLLASWALDGVSVFEILEFLPDLSAEEVEAALHYARLNSEEIDHEIRLNDEV